jgi:hypothetical protein
MSQLPSGIATWLSARQIIIEIVLVVLVGFAFFLKFLYLPGADEALMITMLTLAAFYFLMGFVPASTDNIFVLILSKVFAISSAVCIIGLLFAFLHVSGAKEQLMIGLLSLGVSGFILLFLIITARMPKAIPLIIRFVALGALSLNAFMTLNAYMAQ